MNKTMKILSVLMLAIMLVSVATPVFAATQGTMVTPDKITVDYGNDTDTKDLREMAGKVVGLIRNIAVIAGVILLSVIGVKFMMGSAEEKAEYKKSLVPLVVGIIVVMAATQIVSMIFNLVG